MDEQGLTASPTGGRLVRLPVLLRRQFKYYLFSLIICSAIALPLISLVVLASDGGGDGFAHIWQNVLPRVGPTTIILLVETGVLVALAGFFSAFLVTFYAFPGRGFFAWAMMLPLAIPTYIAAYGFVEFFSFTGPPQTLVRYLGGYASARDYWFPEIRSVHGAAIVLSLVLYPYVFMAVRTALHFQGLHLVEAARVNGAGNWRILRSVLMPLSYPAIILGTTLALMEVINDIGAMEHLGVETLTFSVYSIWLNQSDLAGAAQLALFSLLIVFALIVAERFARQKRNFGGQRSNKVIPNFRRRKLPPLQAFIAFSFCALPILAGFMVPFLVLADYALLQMSEPFDTKLLEAFANSVTYASIAGVVTVLIALGLTYGLRTTKSRFISLMIRVAAIGYAVPGTIVALGIFLPLAGFDNWLDSIMRSNFGMSTGLLITGTGATMVYAYAVRFLAMGEGTLDTGFAKVPKSIDMASRNLGRSPSATLARVLVPIMKPALATGFLLVFIDSLKELSATITLRPLGVNTLSTHIYDYASRSLIEETGLASLIIIVAGIIPVIIVTRTLLDGKTH